MRFGVGLTCVTVMFGVVLWDTYINYLEQTKTHYSVLGVSSFATKAEIKSAYRKKSLEYHPDKTRHRTRNSEDENINKENNDVTQKFYEIVDAYETLSDDTKRREYDQELQRQANHRARLKEEYRRHYHHPSQSHRSQKPVIAFTLSWHLRQLLPMSHDSIHLWGLHIFSLLTYVSIYCFALLSVFLHFYCTFTS